MRERGRGREGRTLQRGEEGLQQRAIVALFAVNSTCTGFVCGGDYVHRLRMTTSIVTSYPWQPSMLRTSTHQLYQNSCHNRLYNIHNTGIILCVIYI